MLGFTLPPGVSAPCPLPGTRGPGGRDRDTPKEPIRTLIKECICFPTPLTYSYGSTKRPHPSDAKGSRVAGGRYKAASGSIAPICPCVQHADALTHPWHAGTNAGDVSRMRRKNTPFSYPPSQNSRMCHPRHIRDAIPVHMCDISRGKGGFLTLFSRIRPFHPHP